MKINFCRGIAVWASMGLVLVPLAGCRDVRERVVGAWQNLEARARGEAPQVLARVGSETITVDEFLAYRAGLPGHGRQLVSMPDHDKSLLTALANQKALSAEALRLKLDQDPAVQRMLQRSRESLLAQVLSDHLLRQQSPVTETEIQQSFHQNAPRYKSLTVAILQFQSLDDARRGLALLRQGKTFETVNRSLPKGHQATFSRGSCPFEMMAAGYALAEGKISDVLRAPSGFYLLRREPSQRLPLDSVRDQIRQQIQQARIQPALSKILAGQKVDVDETLLHSLEESQPATTPHPAR